MSRWCKKTIPSVTIKVLKIALDRVCVCASHPRDGVRPRVYLVLGINVSAIATFRPFDNHPKATYLIVGSTGSRRGAAPCMSS